MPRAGLFHFGAESRGVRHGRVERGKRQLGGAAGRRPASVFVIVDADGEDVQLRLHRIGGAIVSDRGARRQRRQQIAPFIGDDLDPVLARVEGEFLFDVIVRPAPGGRCHHAGGDAVDAPFDARELIDQAIALHGAPIGQHPPTIMRCEGRGV